MLSLPFLPLFFFFFTLSLSLSLSLRYVYKRGFSYFNLLLYPTPPAHTSLGILGTASFIRELIGHIRETDIQWAVDWWHISSMIHSCYKEYCVPLVGLCCYSNYSTCCISRQFGEPQGAPNGEGAFHTKVFIDKILGKLHEAWPNRRVTKGIAPPRYIYPTARYKQWLEDDMKWILRDEKAYMKTSKKARRAE